MGTATCSAQPASPTMPTTRVPAAWAGSVCRRPDATVPTTSQPSTVPGSSSARWRTSPRLSEVARQLTSAWSDARLRLGDVGEGEARPVRSGGDQCLQRHTSGSVWLRAERSRSAATASAGRLVQLPGALGLLPVTVVGRDAGAADRRARWRGRTGRGRRSRRGCTALGLPPDSQCGEAGPVGAGADTDDAALGVT